MARCNIVITDLGNIQEEALSLGKDDIVLRMEIEKPETVEARSVKVVVIEETDIFTTINGLTKSKEEHNRMTNVINPYGDGKASERIINVILYYFGEKQVKVVEFIWNQIYH